MQITVNNFVKDMINNNEFKLSSEEKDNEVKMDHEDINPFIRWEYTNIPNDNDIETNITNIDLDIDDEKYLNDDEDEEIQYIDNLKTNIKIINPLLLASRTDLPKDEKISINQTFIRPKSKRIRRGILSNTTKYSEFFNRVPSNSKSNIHCPICDAGFNS